MQRYSASEFPNHAVKQSNNNRKEPLPQTVQHAIQLGIFVQEQRGKEGVAIYVRGLQQVLPDMMLEPICAHLHVPFPPKANPICEEENVYKPPQKSRNEPDIETILKLMQMMKGKDASDLSTLVQFMGGSGKQHS